MGTYNQLITKQYLKTHTEMSHIVKQKKKYISKRITCELCNKKFNKEETYTKHKKLDHSSNEQYVIPLQKFLRSNKIKNDLPENK